MDGLKIFINNAAKDTGVSAEMCDTIILSMVKAVNNGALGEGGNQMSQLAKLKKKKFTTTNNISDIVTEDTNIERETCKKVVGWMVNQMIRTLDQGGMPALIRMVNLMKKGQQSTQKPVDYSEEVKEINELLEQKK